MKSFAAVLVVCITLVGCGYEATTEAKIGDVSGCQISKVQLKGEDHPMFIARCNETVTATSYYTIGGKVPQTIPVATVTVVEREQAELNKKKIALSKLSDEDKKALGLK